VIDSCHGLELGHESRVMGQLNDGSRGSRVTKCDPLSGLARGTSLARGSPSGEEVMCGEGCIPFHRPEGVSPSEGRVWDGAASSQKSF